MLRDVRVDADCLLGDWGAGFAMAQARLGPGGCTIACAPLASANWRWNWPPSARERQAFGHYLGDFANLQDWPAESRLEIDQARLLVLRTAWMLDQTALTVEPTRCAPRWPPSRWWLRGCSRAWWTVPCRFWCHGAVTDTAGVLLTWGRALHLMDGPDEVHLRTRWPVTNWLGRVRSAGATAAYFTTPQQMATPPRIR